MLWLTIPLVPLALGLAIGWELSIRNDRKRARQQEMRARLEAWSSWPQPNPDPESEEMLIRELMRRLPSKSRLSGQHESNPFSEPEALSPRSRDFSS